jgi:3-hydroxyisobutyrate dehydrogenase-like beta-hydroxyacid dehydrogenase
MTNAKLTEAPKHLVTEGVSIIGVGLMGAAYTARLSALGVPVTVFNRTASKATDAAKANRNVRVAGTLSECAGASPTLVIACSPTAATIGSICEQLAGAVRDKHVTFVVDCGLAEAKLMEDVLFEKGRASAVTNAALFGTGASVVEGAGALINASGPTRSPDLVASRVLPLLQLFGACTHHPGGTATAAFFATAGHLAFMPIVYGLMHYCALMERSAVDPKSALAFFKASNGAMLEGYVPLLATFFEKHDYSAFFFSHQLARDIEANTAETCKAVGVDDRLARLFADYHEQAMRDSHTAPRSFHSVHELICGAVRPPR